MSFGSQGGSASGRGVCLRWGGAASGVCLQGWGVGSAYSGVCLQGWVDRIPLGYYTIWSKSRQYASYWNAFLFIQDGCRMLTKLWEYNVFSCICVSTGGGSVHSPALGHPTPLPHRAPAQHKSPFPHVRGPDMFKLGLHCIGIHHPLPPDVFKPVHFEAQNVGKRAVGI